MEKKITITGTFGIIADIIFIYQAFKNGNTMNTTTLFWIGLASLVTLSMIGLILYWRLQEKIKALSELSFMDSEILKDVKRIDLRVSNNNYNYLLKCINAGKELPRNDKKFTDLEDELLNEKQAKREEKFKELLKILGFEAQ